MQESKCLQVRKIGTPAAKRNWENKSLLSHIYGSRLSNIADLNQKIL